MGIRPKIILLVVGLLVPLIGATGLLAVSLMEDVLLEEMEQRGLSMLSALSVPCSISLASHEIERLDDFLAQFRPEHRQAATKLRGLASERASILQKDGFSLHARRSIQDTDRKGLEQLLRYGARAPIAGSRLSIDKDGQVVYQLTKPWGITGATMLRLAPSDFLRRLAMLIPPPYQNLIRYLCILATPFSASRHC